MFGLTRYGVCAFGCVWHGGCSFPISSSVLHLFLQCLTFFRIAFEPSSPLFGCSAIACMAAAAQLAAALGGSAGGTPTSGQDAPLPLPPPPPSTTGSPEPPSPPRSTSHPSAPSPSPHPRRRRRSTGRRGGPSVGRRTNGRGGLFMEGDRSVAPPKGVIAKINVSAEDGSGLGLDKGDQQRLKKAVAFAIKHILGGVETFCDHEEAKLRSAVEFIEEREPRLSVCESGSGACALLSRALDNRRPRKRQGGVAPAAGAVQAAAAVGAGDGAGTGGGGALPSRGTAEEQLVQMQRDYFLRLEG